MSAERTSQSSKEADAQIKACRSNGKLHGEADTWAMAWNKCVASPAREGEKERERERDANEGNSMGEDMEVQSSAAYSRDSQQLDNPGLY